MAAVQSRADSEEEESLEVQESEEIKHGREKHIHAIFVYLTFIIFYVLSTSESFASHNCFYFVDALKSQFTGVEMREEFSPTFDKSFPDIATVEELLHWFQSGFQHSAFSPNTFDSSDRGAGMKPGYTLGPNKIIGAIRVSQLRFKRGPCSEFPPELGQHGHEFLCQEGGEPMEAFGNFTWNGVPNFQFERDGITLFNGTHPAYTRLPEGSVAKERDTMYSSYFSKRMEERYLSPGWAVTMDPTAPMEVNANAILALVNGKYVDLQTTAVFVDLTIYNPNLDYMCVIKLLAELPPGGGVYTSSEFHVVRVYNRYTATDKRIFALHVIVGFFYAYYLIKELKQFRRQGCVYLQSPTNYLIVANVILYMLGLWYRSQMSSLAPNNVDVDSSDFANFWPSGQCARYAIQLASANCFLNFFQGVEHLSYVPTFALLSDTLKHAGPELLSFMFVFLLVGYGFVQAHTMIFRDRIEGYRSMKHSGFSLMCALLGDFDFDELYDADTILGPFFFIFFIGLAVFVVLNMVIAIISDAYSVCSERMRNKPKVNLTKEMYAHLFEMAEEMPFGIGDMIRKHRLHLEEKVAEGKDKLHQAATMGHETLKRGSLKLVKGAKQSVVKSAKTVYPEDIPVRTPSALPPLQEETETWRYLGGEEGSKQGGGGEQGGELRVNGLSESDASPLSPGLVKQLLAEQKRLVAEQARTNELLEQLLHQAPSSTQFGAAFST
jgi:hypothetical protein